MSSFKVNFNKESFKFEYDIDDISPDEYGIVLFSLLHGALTNQLLLDLAEKAKDNEDLMYVYEKVHHLYSNISSLQSDMKPGDVIL